MLQEPTYSFAKKQAALIIKNKSKTNVLNLVAFSENAVLIPTYMWAYEKPKTR